MNKNYPIYKTTFIDDMRSLVEEAAQNFPESIAISYKENYWDKEVRKVTFSQWREDVRNLGTALISEGLREEKIAIVGENSYGWCCSFFGVMAIGSVTVPVDKELPVQDIDGIITTTGCKAVIFGKASESKIKEILHTGGLKTVCLLISVASENSLDAADLDGKTVIIMDIWLFREVREVFSDIEICHESGYLHLTQIQSLQFLYFHNPVLKNL